MGFANFELRWRVYEVPGFTFNLSPLIDIGRVWNDLKSVKANAWDGYKYSAGLGLRIIWNQSTVIYFEWARSRETGGVGNQNNFYLNFGHIF
jgi:hemolysin activation/secretion protein